ncbi:uncharacterized protein LOC142235268 [Haematobia irritans]|uniref:uncharacterized protein LOC142235268 n=1 Tax=Haematobia irritans TaxID=7368 RepID=UPI003F503772
MNLQFIIFLSPIISVGICLAQDNKLQNPEIQLTYSNEHLSSQLEYLKASNENLKLRLEMIDVQFEQQRQQNSKLMEKFQNVEEKLNELHDSLISQNQMHYSELKDLLETLIDNGAHAMMASQTEFFGQDEKTEILKEFQKVSKLQETILEKMETYPLAENQIVPEDNGVDSYARTLLSNVTGGNASWGFLTQILNNLQSNFTILENIDAKLKVINEKYLEEKYTEDKHRKYMDMAHDLMKFLNQKENPKICIRAKEHKLVCTDEAHPTSCGDYNSSHCSDNKCRLKNVLYGPQAFTVPCENIIDGGGWIIIQRRINGSVDFYRGWSEYKSGFGNLDGEFWIGLDKLHALTATLAPMELLIHLGDHNDIVKYAKYGIFSIGSEDELYELKEIGNYEGNAGDSFTQHKGNKFSTKDRDNDANEWDSCAEENMGAWWYENCQWSNLNGLYYTNGEIPKEEMGRGINWSSFRGYNYSMKFVQMMIRTRQ